jgi:hypothetical protein
MRVYYGKSISSEPEPNRSYGNGQTILRLQSELVPHLVEAIYRLRPSVVSTIITYINRQDKPEANPLTKSMLLDTMEEVWKYVTPTYKGIPSAAIFCRRAKSYLATKDWKSV